MPRKYIPESAVNAIKAKRLLGQGASGSSEVATKARAANAAARAENDRRQRSHQAHDDLTLRKQIFLLVPIMDQLPEIICGWQLAHREVTRGRACNSDQLANHVDLAVPISPLPSFAHLIFPPAMHNSASPLVSTSLTCATT